MPVGIPVGGTREETRRMPQRSTSKKSSSSRLNGAQPMFLPFSPEKLRECVSVSGLLGQGGYGEVYHATYKTPDGQEVEVALKLLHPRFNERDQNGERQQQLKLFLREASILQKLSHRSILKCYGLAMLPPGFPGIGNSRETWAMILECLEDSLFDQILPKTGSPRYTVKQAIGWMLDLASSLQYLHDRKIIHRDVKPANVLLCKAREHSKSERGIGDERPPTVKLVDFGLHAWASSDPSNRLVHTAEGSTRPMTQLRRRAPVSRSGADNCDGDDDYDTIFKQDVFYEVGDDGVARSKQDALKLSAFAAGDFLYANLPNTAATPSPNRLNGAAPRMRTLSPDPVAAPRRSGSFDGTRMSLGSDCAGHRSGSFYGAHRSGSDHTGRMSGSFHGARRPLSIGRSLQGAPRPEPPSTIRESRPLESALMPPPLSLNEQQLKPQHELEKALLYVSSSSDEGASTAANNADDPLIAVGTFCESDLEPQALQQPHSLTDLKLQTLCGDASVCAGTAAASDPCGPCRVTAASTNMSAGAGAVSDPCDPCDPCGPCELTGRKAEASTSSVVEQSQLYAAGSPKTKPTLDMEPTLSPSHRASHAQDGQFTTGPASDSEPTLSPSRLARRTSPSNVELELTLGGVFRSQESCMPRDGSKAELSLRPSAQLSQGPTAQLSSRPVAQLSSPPGAELSWPPRARAVGAWEPRDKETRQSAASNAQNEMRRTSASNAKRALGMEGSGLSEEGHAQEHVQHSVVGVMSPEVSYDSNAGLRPEVSSTNNEGYGEDLQESPFVNASEETGNEVMDWGKRKRQRQVSGMNPAVLAIAVSDPSYEAAGGSPTPYSRSPKWVAFRPNTSASSPESLSSKSCCSSPQRIPISPQSFSAGSHKKGSLASPCGSGVLQIRPRKTGSAKHLLSHLSPRVASQTRSIFEQDSVGIRTQSSARLISCRPSLSPGHSFTSIRVNSQDSMSMRGPCAGHEDMGMVARVMSVYQLMKDMLKPSFNKEFLEVFHLTGQTGSPLYMAPEVFRGHPYNDRVDVFSFGVLLYEVLLRKSVVSIALNEGWALREFAFQMSSGYRPPPIPGVPVEAWSLISACWDDDPVRRPDMATVSSVLKDLYEVAPEDVVWAPSLPGLVHGNSKGGSGLTSPSQKQRGKSDDGNAPGCNCVICWCVIC